MKPTDENRFNEAWRRAFDDAELPPPAGGWERLEPHLPPKQRFRPLAWWPLAAALLLLLGGLGWWVLPARNQAPGTAASERVPTASSTGPEEAVATRTLPASPTDQPAAAPRTRVPRRQEARRSDRPSLATSIRREKSERIQDAAPHTADVPQQPHHGEQTARYRPSESGTAQALKKERPNDAERSMAPRPESIRGLGSTSEQVPAAPAEVPIATPATWFPGLAEPNAIRLSAVAARLPSLVVQVPARQPQRPPVVKPKTHPRYWIEGGAYVARFNPVARTSPQLTMASANYGLTSSSYDNLSGGTTMSAARIDRGNAPALSYVSFVVDVRAGRQLSRHWYLDGGLQFLRGHSVLTSDLLLVDRTTSTRTSFYAELLRNTSTQRQADPAVFNAQNVVVPARNSFRYSFDYASVPLSVGYRIQPDRPVSYALSVGLAGDVFLQNRLDDASDASIPPVTYRPADGVYRSLLLSGIATASLHLKLTDRWSLVARGLYRQALTPGIRSGGSVQIYPHTLGVGFSGQYRF
jgi:hypothetical protein